MRSGQEPDDYVNPSDLSALMRTQLKDAFRAINSVQKRLSSELQLGASHAAAGTT